ncbi:MAG: AbrB/MazE/SpoVT family DNA-binding domain-containing protein, partial [Dehalococcoidales bacterium]|nr:AbrB/MazE/SpoVT family DNA-binding domain-containing protein [Dehalococcoidales bacterium]
MVYNIMDKIPKFYGAVTVGERGQIAIPAEARRELEIPPGTKLLAFGNTEAKALMFVRVEFMAEFVQTVSTLMSRFEQTMKN